MNYSYIMGIQNVDELVNNGFKITTDDGDFTAIFSNDKKLFYEDFIINNLSNGYWNEYLGDNIIFIFKFEDGSIKKYILDDSNEVEILNLCKEFAQTDFISVVDMLKDVKFYRDNYFNN